jgi:hypothetical protein
MLAQPTLVRRAALMLSGESAPGAAGPSSHSPACVPQRMPCWSGSIQKISFTSGAVKIAEIALSSATVPSGEVGAMSSTSAPLRNAPDFEESTRLPITPESQMRLSS